MTESQTTSHVLMIRPVRFAGNEQTAESNRFQNLSENIDACTAQAQALAEFDSLTTALQAANVRVTIIADTPDPHTPDAIFPNNWFSTHADGTVVLYPMQAANRHLERRPDILDQLSAQGLRISEITDLSRYETADKFLEGTGSLVLDRVNRLAYACLSPRTDLDVLGEFAQRLDYELVTFDATDINGAPIYHTNVLMCIGSRFAVVCAEAIVAHERAAVLTTLRHTGHEVIDISIEQMHTFAGNLLELQTERSGACVALSQRAYEALTPTQRARLESLANKLIVAAIPTIEHLGGGSVRCMLAEIFLPQR